MKKVCRICKTKFEDMSLDGRHDWCPKCEKEWDEIQRKRLEDDEGENP